MPQLSAKLIERGPEQWVVVADRPHGEFAIMHIWGAEHLEKVRAIFEQVRQEKASLDAKPLSDPLDTLERTA